MKKTSFALFLLLLTILTTPLFAATVLVPKNSVWKYLDNGTNQGSVWRGSGFVDSAWSSGAGQLGYGDGDESTVVSFGSNSSAKYITTYLLVGHHD